MQQQTVSTQLIHHASEWHCNNTLSIVKGWRHVTPHAGIKPQRATGGTLDHTQGKHTYVQKQRTGTDSSTYYIQVQVTADLGQEHHPVSHLCSEGDTALLLLLQCSPPATANPSPNRNCDTSATSPLL